MQNYLEWLEPWLKLEYFGNTVREYLIALSILLVFWIFFRFVKHRLFKGLLYVVKRTTTKMDDQILQSVEIIPGPLYFFLSLYIAFQTIQVHFLLMRITEVILIVLTVFWSTQIMVKIVEFVFAKVAERQGVKKSEKTTTTVALSFILKFILWTVGFLLILSNLGVDITALIASLGIGGIAVALAVQNILGDMFSSLTIYLDRPFEIGDYIVVGEHSGTVKKIGLKSTRIQALQGEEIIISNKELTTARVQNFKRMKKRRIAFEFVIAPNTSSQTLTKVPAMIETLIRKNELAEFDRAHFKAITEKGFVFEVVYQMKTTEYNDYMNTQQQINLDLLKTFEKEKINISFTVPMPTPPVKLMTKR